MKLIREDISADIQKRIDAIRLKIKSEGLDAILLASNSNIFYTSGRLFRGYVYITPEHPALYFVVRPLSVDTSDDTIILRKPELIPSILKEKGMPLPKRLGLEFDDLYYSEITRLQAAFPEATAENCSHLLRKVRMVKTQWELDCMRYDGLRQASAYRRFSKCYREDMTDVEFQIEIERLLRLEGCLGYIRTSGSQMEINMGSVIAGDNADAPSPYDFTMGGAGVDPSLPVGANGAIMHPGETVMIDVCGAFNGYQTDMTRVWKIGEIPALAEKAHECSRNILRECEKMAVPGCRVATLYDKAIEIARNEGLSKYFMGHAQQAPFIGHGVGIQLNELPVVTSRSRDVFEENMTIALEPKFVIPHVGAVGIENTYIVTPTGLECITPFPEEIQSL